MAGTPAPDINAINASVNIYRTLLSVVCGILVWEWLTTFRAECRVVFGNRWNPISTAYIVARYWTMAALTGCLYLSFWPGRTSESCAKAVMWTYYAPIPALFAGGFILTMRTNAVWNENRLVMIGLTAAMLLIMSVQLTLPLLTAYPRYTLFPPGVSACLPAETGSDDRFKLYFAVPVIFDAAATILSTMQTMRIWRRQSVSILDAVMRDQIQYFWLCLLCSLLNISHYSYVVNHSGKNATLLGPLSIAMHGIAVCRMVLNLGSTIQRPAFSEPKLPSLGSPTLSQASLPSVPLQLYRSDMVYHDTVPSNYPQSHFVDISLHHRDDKSLSGSEK